LPTQLHRGRGRGQGHWKSAPNLCGETASAASDYNRVVSCRVYYCVHFNRFVVGLVDIERVV
jgi:hypothetical protein